MQIDATSYRSPNHGPRTEPISAIVVHHGGGTKASDLAWLCNPASKVSSHYYIDRQGAIYQLVPDDRVAWHAGVSALDGDPDVNAYSLSVETEHRPGQNWPQAQMAALEWLCKEKATQYRIPTGRVVSHRAVALPPGRKDDPADAPLAPEPAFRQWAAGLAPAPRPTIPHGFVLTSAPGLSALSQYSTLGRYPLLVCVTAWGLGDWTDTARLHVAAMTERLVVRTTHGDPSWRHPYPHWEGVVGEVAPWATLRPGLDIVIGNEPNARPTMEPAGYAWHLTRAVAACRERFPAARIVAPALSPAHPVTNWAQSPEWRAAIAGCDAYGVHQYAHHSLVTDDTGHAAANAASVPADKPWCYSEYGIHDPATPDTEKARRYKHFVSTLTAGWAAAYHLCHAPTDPDQRAYAIGPAGVAVYGGTG